MMHFCSWSKGQKAKKDMKTEALMDNFLNVLGLWRKPIAKDGFCLFRAVSEQVFGTQTYFYHIFKLGQQCFREWSGIQDENYLWTELDVMQTLSRMYKREFIIYETAGKFPVNFTNYGCEKKIVLCRLDQGHLECVFPKSYMQDAAICQSIIYEILYRYVFKLDAELEEAVQLIRDQNKTRRRLELCYRSPTGSPDSSHSKSSDEQDVYKEFSRYPRDSKDRYARKITPPLPYRIAKALDPLIYRNTELDIWEEEKREAVHRERYLSVTFAPGDKCRVVSENGPIYHGHIQELSDTESPVLVFIEELGEKQEVPLQSLRPAKTSLRSGWAYKEYRRKKSLSPEMPVAQAVNGNMPQMTPPIVPKNMNSPVRPVNPVINPVNLHSNGNPVPGEILVNGFPHRPELRLPIPHSQSYIMSPEGVPIATNSIMFQQPPQALPPPFQSNPPPFTSQVGSGPHYTAQSPQSSGNVANPNNQVAPAGDPSLVYPCIWVPYMDSISLGQVDVNSPPSKEITGLDLPLSDTNTLRFFFNLGVEHYRSISQLSCSLALTNGATNQGQSPVVYCQSKNPNDSEIVTQSTCPSNIHSIKQNDNKSKGKSDTEKNESDVNTSIGSSEMDEKGSMSSDSGCESLGSNSGNVNEIERKTEKNGNVSLKDIGENALESITAGSDMSISDTNDGAVSLADSQEHHTKSVKPRRKYYMYGNLRLVKPIKEIPKRFLTMLNSINAEKSRVEGEPIILSPPSVPHGGELQMSNLVPYPGYNVEMPCCVPAHLTESSNISHGEGSINRSSSSSSSSTNSQTSIDTKPSSSDNGFPSGTSYSPQSAGTVYFADKSYPGAQPTYGTPFVTPSPGVGTVDCGTTTQTHAPLPPPPPSALTYSISHQVSAQMALTAPPQ